MNITSHTSPLPLATVVNPPTDNLRRENTTRELIAPPTAAAQSAAEKGVASDKERAKNPGQPNEQIDFTSLKKQAEENDSRINDASKEHSQSGKQGDQQNEQNNEQKSSQQQENEQPEQPAISSADEQLIKELSARDAEVKRHENAHASVGGAATGTPTYQYQQGPDGKRYAVGGEVSVDLSAVSGDPTATIAKMQKVQAAALAPMNPSIQDTKVAASAAKIILQAQSELLSLDAERKQLQSSSEGDLSTEQETTATANGSANDFDTLINQTLAAQDQISPERSEDVLARAGRIEHFYAEISHAYQKPASSQFKLTA